MHEMSGDPPRRMKGNAVQEGARRVKTRPACIAGLLFLTWLQPVEAGNPLGALLADLDSGQPATRIEAAKAIRELGREAAPAADELARHLKDEYFDVRTNLGATLVTIGKPAVPALREALRGPHWYSRVNALMALEAIGPDAGVPEDELRPLLRDDSSEIVQGACRVLAGCGRPSRALVLELAGLLDGDAAAEAKDALLSLLGKPSEEAREAALSLEPLQRNATGDRLALLSGLMAKAGIEAGFKQVLARYESDRAANNEWFCKTLEEYGFPAVEVVPAMVREIGTAAKNPDPWPLARLCIEAGRYGSEAAAVVPALTAVLKHEGEGARRYAAQALGNIGKGAAAALPALRALAGSDSEGRVREWAAEAVRKIE